MIEYEIKPKGKLSIGLRELWEFRELFYFFTWRDIKVKYKQAVLGVLWAVLQPLFMTFIFTFLLGSAISEKASIEIPYPLFALSGMLLWGIFSGGMSNAANSMVSNANIIKKIYFPRLIIPISGVLVSVIDFFMALIVFFGMLIYYSASVRLSGFLFIPVAAIMAAVASMGLGMILASLNVKYRDIRYIIPFIIQALLFLTPVIYPISIASDSVFKTILQFNPMAGALELFRSVFSAYSINWETVIYSTFSSLVLFLTGIIYFRKTESHFADLA